MNYIIAFTVLSEMIIVSSKSLKYLELKLSCNDLFQNRPLMAIYIYIYEFECMNKEIIFFP